MSQPSVKRSHHVTLLPGDGVGPEVVRATCRVLEATRVGIEWEHFDIGLAAVKSPGDPPLPLAVLESVRRNGVALKGPVTTVVGGGFRSVNISLRRQLDLYCQVRLCRSFPGVPSLFTGIDIVLMRETMEDLYAGVEFDAYSEIACNLIELLRCKGSPVPPHAGLSIKFTSEEAVRRMVTFAFRWARRNGRRKITIVHKATVMRSTDGLFLSAAHDVASANSDIEFDDCSVDNLAAQLVRQPERFDVLVTSNLYGDILSDLLAGMVGSVGLVPGANYGDDIALFETAHGSAPRHAGHNRANPIATILSGAMLLGHLGHTTAAHRVDDAVRRVLAEGSNVTYDVARNASDAKSTAQVADAVIAAMR